MLHGTALYETGLDLLALRVVSHSRRKLFELMLRRVSVVKGVCVWGAGGLAGQEDCYEHTHHLRTHFPEGFMRP